MKNFGSSSHPKTYVNVFCGQSLVRLHCATLAGVRSRAASEDASKMASSGTCFSIRTGARRSILQKLDNDNGRIVENIRSGPPTVKPGSLVMLCGNFPFGSLEHRPNPRSVVREPRRLHDKDTLPIRLPAAVPMQSLNRVIAQSVEFGLAQSEVTS